MLRDTLKVLQQKLQFLMCVWPFCYLLLENVSSDIFVEILDVLLIITVRVYYYYCPPTSEGSVYYGFFIIVDEIYWFLI